MCIYIYIYVYIYIYIYIYTQTNGGHAAPPQRDARRPHAGRPADPLRVPREVDL